MFSNIFANIFICNKFVIYNKILPPMLNVYNIKIFKDLIVKCYYICYNMS